MQIPFVDLSREATMLSDEIKNEVDLILRSGNFINGPKVKLFEKEFAEYCGVKHAISVGNGSDGLTFILKALNIGKGDTVICPANSFIASAWSIVAVGAVPIFCDVNNHLQLEVKDLSRIILPSTKAIMGVHLTGKLCDVEEIKTFCEKNNLFFIEDAAQAIGASDPKGSKAGSFGIAASFSLHPLKNLSVCGDGGVITTNDSEIASKANLLRNHGLENRDKSKIWGFNSRLDEIQAAIGLIKIKYIDQWTQRYIEIAKIYSEKITDKVFKPKTKYGYKDVFHNYIIKVPANFRDLIMNELSKKGVETKIHYPIPLHLQECAKNLGYKEGDIPNTELLAKSMISLPIFPLLNNNEIEYIIENLNSTIDKLNFNNII